MGAEEIKVMSKPEAQKQMLKLGVSVSSCDIAVGRFSIRKGHNSEGLGVCFVADYKGILTRFSWLNILLNFFVPYLPENVLKNYVIYVRAFSGHHSRKGEYAVMEQTDFVSYNSSNHTFKARGGEWQLKGMEIVPYEKPMARLA